MQSRSAWLGACLLAFVPAVSFAAISITEYTVPHASSGPFFITAGPDGALWFTEQFANKIGRITTSGSFTEFAVPGWRLQQSGMDRLRGRTGRTRRRTAQRQYRADHTGGVLPIFSIPGGGCPFGITAGPDNALWFTEPCFNHVGRIHYHRHLHPLYCADRRIRARRHHAGVGRGAVVRRERGRQNRVRHHQRQLHRICRSRPRPTGPKTITAGPDGALWFAGVTSNMIGRVTTSGSITEFTVPTGTASPSAWRRGRTARCGWHTRHHRPDRHRRQFCRIHHSDRLLRNPRVLSPDRRTRCGSPRLPGNKIGQVTGLAIAPTPTPAPTATPTSIRRPSFSAPTLTVPALSPRALLVLGILRRPRARSTCATGPPESRISSSIRAWRRSLP